MSAERVRALLEGLRHEDVLDAAGTHSRAVGESAGGAREAWTFRAAHHGLGARRLSVFGAVHHDALRAAQAELGKSPRGAEALALSGRLSRLLGETAAARAALTKSIAAAPSPAALTWLGELELHSSPGAAEKLLSRAAKLAPSSVWPLLWRGLARLRLGRLEEALGDLDAALPLCAPPPFVLRLVRCEALMQKGDFAAAGREASAAADLDPASPGGYDLAGLCRSALGDKKGAEELFHRARSRDTDVAGAYLYRDLGVRLAWDDPRAFMKELEAAIARRPGSAVLLAERAELRRDPKLCQYELAIEDYRAAARLAPAVAWLAAVQARAENNMGGGSAGLAEFDRAIALCPESGWMRAWRGAVLARVGRREEALADLGAAVERMPWYGLAYAWRGALLNKLGRFSEAARDLDTAVLLDPDYLFSRYERFQSRRALGDWAGAVEDVNASFRADPKYTWLGVSGLVAAEKGKALLDQLAAAIKRRPKDAWLRAWRGQSLLQLGRPERAFADLDAAAKLAPKEPLILAWRAWAAADLGRMEAALSDLKLAARLEPGLWQVHRVLCGIRAAQGRLEEALAEISRVTELMPTAVSHLVLRAQLEAELGRVEEALANLAKAAQLDPAYSEVPALAARLRLEKGELDEARRQAEAAIASPRPAGLAFLVRGLIRQKGGDLEGQIADFQKALETDPGLFSPEQRREIARLVKGGRHA